MRNSLMLKLMGAFLLVIALGSAVVAYLTSRATQNAFTLYTTRSGQAYAQRLLPVLAEYYAANGSFTGVDSVLLAELDSSAGMMMGNGHGMGTGHSGAGMGMMAAMGQRLVLSDAEGWVVSDSQKEWLGQKVSPAQLKYGTPVLVAGRQVGTMIVTPLDFAGSETPTGQFLSSVNQAIISSAVIAGLLALLLGAGLFFQIIGPLRQLTQAAAAIAQGRLEERVHIRSRDELGELGQTFNRMAENLMTAEVQRKHLIADVAHELRTPLTAIQGTLEGMQDGVFPLDQEQVAALYSETLLLNRLVGDLRLISLAEAGQLKLEKQTLNLAEFLPGVVERDRAQAEPRQIRLVTAIASDLPVVMVDADRITQVLNNLIANALRYTPSGGTITVGALRLMGGRGVEISVADSGVGIAAEDLPYVFDRFYRADKSRTRASGGSGLGLAIVKQLVEAHGGMVGVESPIAVPGQPLRPGTRFFLTLPEAGLTAVF